MRNSYSRKTGLPAFLSVLEIDDAELMAGELFKTRFHDKIPAYPRHFVAVYKSNEGEIFTAGYIHYSRMEAVYLAGGLVVDERLYRKMPRAHLRELRSYGSIGEILMRNSIPKLQASAVFACIGDAMSANVNMRVGLQPTKILQLYAIWISPESNQIQEAVATRISKLIPF